MSRVLFSSLTSSLRADIIVLDDNFPRHVPGCNVNYRERAIPKGGHADPTDVNAKGLSWETALRRFALDGLYAF